MRRPARVLRRGWPIGVGLGCVLTWLVFERAVAGPGYRWTTWDELESHFEPDVSDEQHPATPPPSEAARRLDGRRVFVVGQLSPAPSPTGPPVCVVRAPVGVTFDAGWSDVAIRNGGDPPALAAPGQVPQGGPDEVVRLWGRLAVAPAVGRRAWGSPMEIDVDRVQYDPPALFDALAPHRPTAWVGWLVGPPLAAVALAAGLRLALRVLRHFPRAVTVVAAAVAVLAVAVRVAGPAPVELTVYFQHRSIECIAGPAGIDVRLETDVLSDLTPLRLTRTDGSYFHDLHRCLGLRGASFYTVYDWGNTHAHVAAGLSIGWVVAGGIAAAAFAARAAAARRRRPGCCRRCGYDLRASPARCPECGRAVEARSVIR